MRAMRTLRGSDPYETRHSRVKLMEPGIKRGNSEGSPKGLQSSDAAYTRGLYGAVEGDVARTGEA